MNAAVQMRIHKRESCLRKIAHATWVDAEVAATRLRESPAYESHGSPELAYHCIYGEHWHVGRSSPRSRYKTRRVLRLLKTVGHE